MSENLVGIYVLPRYPRDLKIRSFDQFAIIYIISYPSGRCYRTVRGMWQCQLVTLERTLSSLELFFKLFRRNISNVWCCRRTVELFKQNSTGSKEMVVLVRCHNSKRAIGPLFTYLTSHIRSLFGWDWDLCHFRVRISQGTSRSLLGAHVAKRRKLWHVSPVFPKARSSMERLDAEKGSERMTLQGMTLRLGKRT